jgi:phosphoribosylanthranilate isomerase
VVLVKVCGITSVEDEQMCVATGADALGYNFFPRSPRYVTPEAAATIHTTKALRVGVFVNEPAEFVAEVARVAHLDVVQLHGAEVAILPGVRVWRAMNAGPDFDPAEVEGVGDEVEAFVLDSPAPGSYGGTGKPFDWSRIPSLTKRIVLAGGLDGSNVAEAIRIASPWGVDACSRLESTPGRKDPAKVAAFVAAAKGK